MFPGDSAPGNVLDQLDALPDEGSKRFVAILNEKVEIGRLFNALGHMTAGLAAQLSVATNLCFLEYRDADGGVHPRISHFPFIVLRAENSNQIRKVRQEALAHALPYTDFTRSMTLGTSAEQLTATVNTRESDLEYLGICLFGDTDTLRQLTKRFSLFKCNYSA